jgi:hypothetical protein
MTGRCGVSSRTTSKRKANMRRTAVRSASSRMSRRPSASRSGGSRPVLAGRERETAGRAVLLDEVPVQREVSYDVVAHPVLSAPPAVHGDRAAARRATARDSGRRRRGASGSSSAGRRRSRRTPPAPRRVLLPYRRSRRPPRRRRGARRIIAAPTRTAAARARMARAERHGRARQSCAPRQKGAGTGNRPRLLRHFVLVTHVSLAEGLLHPTRSRPGREKSRWAADVPCTAALPLKHQRLR